MGTLSDELRNISLTLNVCIIPFVEEGMRQFLLHNKFLQFLGFFLSRLPTLLPNSYRLQEIVLFAHTVRWYEYVEFETAGLYYITSRLCTM